jgi:hypothetical protein
MFFSGNGVGITGSSIIYNPITNTTSFSGNVDMNYNNIVDIKAETIGVSPTTPFVASGYASSFYNSITDRTYYVFTSLVPGSLTVATTAAVEYFAVGGGGGGAAVGATTLAGGGGGAGGLQTNNLGITAVASEYYQIGTAGTISAGTYSISVGAGGAGGSATVVSGANGYAYNGGNTTFSGPGVSVIAY